MRSNKGNGSRAAWARVFIVLGAVLGLGLSARPAAAAPFAYVTNLDSGTVSVIDTATNMVVATVTVGDFPAAAAVTPDGKHADVANNAAHTVSVIDTATNTVVATVTVGILNPSGVAFTPDGKHAYVTNDDDSGTVSVIDTATNKVVATVTVGSPAFLVGVAVTPDGKHAYVANQFGPVSGTGTVSVIDTATNTVVATVTAGADPFGVAVTPDGKHAYVPDLASGTVSVIATATNTVVATVTVGNGPQRVAVTPDGKHVYVTNGIGGTTVSVIATASNTVVATVTVGNGPIGVAVTPDGKHAYVANQGDNTVSVIATASNTVVATVTVGGQPVGVGIIPPPPGVAFLAFGAKLAIQFGSIPTKDAFGLGSNFTLSTTAPGINPLTDPVTLQVGTFATTIPPGSFKKREDGSFFFQGVIHGVGLGALIKPTGTLRYAFQAQARGSNLTGTVNTVYLTLTIGGDSGATSVTAEILTATRSGETHCSRTVQDRNDEPRLQHPPLRLS